MKYIDEFRDKEKAQALLIAIRKTSKKKVNIMEICGTHTHSIAKYGIKNALPESINLISGPGCPVCVTSASDIERIIEFSRSEKNAIIATFGDMMRVPGKTSTLMEERSMGADVRVVYSPLGAIDIAKENPEKQVVFYSVGFETTAPTVAATLIKAKEEGLGNLSALSLHKLTPPAMKALMDGGGVNIDGFICPGHVTAIIGAGAYEFLASRYKSPCVVAGFEPLDVLMGLLMLTRQLEEGRAEIEIEYNRVVSWEGNLMAQEVLNTVFEPCDAVWRGIGSIPLSGLRIKDGFSSLDAEKRFSIKSCEADEPKGCMCGEVLKGIAAPEECPLFASTCTPDYPAGPCMVSSEGTCAACYKYRAA
ncbi:MAG: hydrogenase formation protein HypD [Deltaproteobacteria bacterium]|nr:hydrogenase formation protein HypD [Deltaproteobacteria bacterium]